MRSFKVSIITYNEPIRGYLSECDGIGYTELLILGTASAYPTVKRAVAAVILRGFADGTMWLFDCGEGTQVQIQKSPHAKLSRISSIFISHLHGDHLFGLPGLLSTKAMLGFDGQSSTTPEFSITNPPMINIYGPKGLRKYLRVALGLSRFRASFTYAVHELIMQPEHCPRDWSEWTNTDVDPVKDPPLAMEHPGRDIHASQDGFWYDLTNVQSSKEFAVHAVSLRHTIPSLGFVIIQPQSPPRINIEAVRSFGIPDCALLRRFKMGEEVEFNGQIIKPEQALHPSVRGHHIAIMGDSFDSSEVERLLHKLNHTNGSEVVLDALVHEATLEDGMRSVAIEKGHSTPVMAVEFAKSVNARLVVLTHFSQRYERQQVAETRPLDENEDGSSQRKLRQKDTPTVDILLEDARTVNFNGDLILADDLMLIKIPTPC